MGYLNLNTVIVTYEKQIWAGLRPMPSVHKHFGFVGENNGDIIKISPDLTWSFRNDNVRANHELTIEKRAHPTIKITSMEEAKRKTKIIRITYDDPCDFNGVFSLEATKEFRHSTFNLIGYLVNEDKNHYWVAPAIFEYDDGQIYCETPHIVPKPAILSVKFLKQKSL